MKLLGIFDGKIAHNSMGQFKLLVATKRGMAYPL